MKLRFNRPEMAEILSGVCSVAVTRSPKDILKCVRIDASSDVLLLSATDLEMSIRCAATQVEVKVPGVTVVVAETLAKIVHECTDEVLSVEAKGNLLHLRGAASHFQIVTQDSAEFPAVPCMKGEPDIKVEYAVLRRLIGLTTFAAARESTRYAINGVLWEVEDETLTLAATDGRRLSLARGKLTRGKKPVQPRIIVPAKALSLLARLPVEPDMQVGVKITTNQLLLDLGRVVISTSLVEGQFPKYQDVIPTDCDQVAELNTAEFLIALKQAALLTNEESKGVRFAFSEGSLTLSSRAPEQGEVTVVLAVRYQGEPLEIGFNPVFLLDMLRVIEADSMSFAVKGAKRPGMIRLGDDFVYVIMPVDLS